MRQDTMETITNQYIYKITNKQTGKLYIGKTKHSIYRRMMGHFEDAQRQDKNSHRKLLQAIREYGEKAFSIEVVEEVPAAVDVFERERHYITMHDSVNTGYNMIGDGGVKSTTVCKTDVCSDVIQVIQEQINTTYEDTETTFTTEDMLNIYNTIQNLPEDTLVQVKRKIKFNRFTASMNEATNNVLYAKYFLNRLFQVKHNTSFDVKSVSSWKKTIDGVKYRGRTYTYGFM